MNLQEMLTTNNPEQITDAELKEVAYGLTYGEFALELQPQQRELRARLRKIEAAEKAALRARANLPNLWKNYQDDSDDGYM